MSKAETWYYRGGNVNLVELSGVSFLKSTSRSQDSQLDSVNVMVGSLDCSLSLKPSKSVTVRALYLFTLQSPRLTIINCDIYFNINEM